MTVTNKTFKGDMQWLLTKLMKSSF